MVLDFNIFKLLVLSSVFGVILFAAYKICRTTHQRLSISALLFGMFLYNGIAAADKTVDIKYMFLFVIFILAASVGFFFGVSTFRKLPKFFYARVNSAFEKSRNHWWWKATIAVYIILHLSNLVFPIFKLNLLISPPAPDIRTWFQDVVSGDSSGSQAIARYAILLIGPFFYISLFHIRRRPVLVALILMSIMYIRYVEAAYIGRSEIFANLVLLFMMVWFFMPKGRYRTAFVTAIVAVVPLMIVFFRSYVDIRLGVSVADVDLLGAATETANTEFGFLKATGVPLIESGARMDLSRYLAWVFTLPLPGFLKGNLDVALINYELSEVVLSRSIGSREWYVVLPGLLAESIYIYGLWFFWIHAFFIGFMLSFFCRMSEGSPYLGVMFLFIVVMFMYNINRAGIAGVLPVLVNGFMLFYIVSLFLILMKTSRPIPMRYRN